MTAVRNNYCHKFFQIEISMRSVDIFFFFHFKKQSMNIFEQLPNNRFKCRDCSKTYSREDNVLQHYDEKHRLIRKICPVCNKETTRKNYARHLKLHDKRKQTRKIKIQCELEIDADGKIFSKIVEFENQRFVLMPFESTISTEVRVEIAKKNHDDIETKNKKNKTIIQEAYESAISGTDVLLSQSIQ